VRVRADAPFTFGDIDGAVREARYARRLGYRSKSLVRPEHAAPLNDALTPSDDEVRRATAIVDGFEAAGARGEDRALVDGTASGNTSRRAASSHTASTCAIAPAGLQDWSTEFSGAPSPVTCQSSSRRSSSWWSTGRRERARADDSAGGSGAGRVRRMTV
jgi:hypothetical protein